MSVTNPVQIQLATVRKGRGLGAAELARRTGVSRQTIYAIEAGSYVPNTEVALRLARELDVSVEQLFSLPTEPAPPRSTRQVEILSEDREFAGQGVRVCRVGEQWIGVPARAAQVFLSQADGILDRPVSKTGGARLALASPETDFEKRILVAGCDPAIGLLAGVVEKLSDAEVVAAPAPSSLALKWLKQGKAHIAGTHLEDPKTGEYNLPFIHRYFPRNDVMVVTFACWEEGFVVPRGNPKHIRKVEDLTGKGIRFVNRQKGSGSRALLDRSLKKAGISPERVSGYKRILTGHLTAAEAVASGEADCCIATSSAALAYGLGFVPLREERFDFVIPKKNLDLPPVKVLLDVLQRAELRRSLGLIAGYDTTQTGVARA